MCIVYLSCLLLDALCVGKRTRGKKRDVAPFDSEANIKLYLLIEWSVKCKNWEKKKAMTFVSKISAFLIKYNKTVIYRMMMFLVKLCGRYTYYVSLLKIAETNKKILCHLLLHGNIDQTLVNSLHGLLNFEISGLDCRVITTDYNPYHWINM